MPLLSRLASVVGLPALLACSGKDSTAPGKTNPPPEPPAVTLSIDVSADRHPISPLIYGSNQDDGTSKWTIRRYGGNRLTGYNWENNFSNAGSDYNQQSDDYLIWVAGLTSADRAAPARAMTHFHDQSLAMGAQSIVTLQMAGWVAADGKGPVSAAETAPSARWVRVAPKKNAAFTTTPDTADGVVYMDELVNLLVQKYGNASTPNGVGWYSLDNEPALWSSTHPRIHPQPVGAQELVDKSIALASAVKDVDPAAKILGPAAYGFMEYLSLQDAPDWATVKGSSAWFLDWYLAKMKQADATGGRRLLDALDLHYYPEARGDHRIVDADATTAADVAARLQAPRTLWDAKYRENSWIGQWQGDFLPLIPRVRRSIDEQYPGTMLALTEYDFGGGATVSGGIAEADVLGVFGREGVDVATRWGSRPEDVYAAAGFRLYRDYDGQGGTFGATSVRALTSDTARVSVFASIDDANASVLHVIALNKDTSATVVLHLDIAGTTGYASGKAWAFDATHSSVLPAAAVSRASPTAFAITVPKLSATHIVLRATP